MDETKPQPDALIPAFKLERVLNQDQAGRRTILYGSINALPAVLILERAPFPTSSTYLQAIPQTLGSIKNLGANDIYFWYLASSSSSPPPSLLSEAQIPNTAEETEEFADLKINLIYPCTEKHVKKYSKQGVRMVTETRQTYVQSIRPYMQAQREQGHLNWVFNIIDGKTEVDQVIYRTPLGQEGNEGFLLLPDLNWDRSTLEALHLLGLVERRDIWSLRDLRKKHVPWLLHMRRKLIDATVKTYPELEEDQLKLYVHYQPTYYHFHVHIVHVQLESGATQATGKAFGLESIITQIESMAGDQEAGMDEVDLHYTVGEASQLWTEVFEPLKKKTDRVSPPQ